MKSRMIKKLLLIASTVTTLGGAQLAPAQPTQTSAPAKTVRIDRHAKDRETFIDVYKALNLDFEGDFPAIYWDHGNIAAPGGVKLDPKKTITARKITSLTGARIPVKSYRSSVQRDMNSMAEGVLPPAYKGQFKIELVKLNLGTLNKSNIPDFGDTSFTNAVYYVASAQRREYQQDAITEHLKIAEDLFGVDRFYSLPLARQVAIVDMIYPLRDNFKNSKFGKAVLASNWLGPNADEPNLTNKQVAMREAWASKEEKNKRRHIARKLLLAWGDERLLPKNLDNVYADIAQNLPAGETKLAEFVGAVLGANADINEQRIIAAQVAKQPGLKK